MSSQFFLVIKSFNGVSIKFINGIWSLVGVLWMFKGSFMGIYKKFKVVSRVFEKNSKIMFRMFPRCWVSRIFQGCSKEVFRVFQWSFKGDSRKIEGVFNEVWIRFRTLLRLFQGRLRNALRDLSQGSFIVSKRSSKGGSREFQRCLRKGV